MFRGFDIIDILLPGAFCFACDSGDKADRAAMAKAFSEALPLVRDEMPDDFYATASNEEIMAACIKYWRKGGAPDILVAELEKRSQWPGRISGAFQILLSGVKTKMN